MNDVSQLNPVEVARIVRPTRIVEVQELVRATRSAIAIGGGRYSMGGQTACRGCVALDMKGLDHVLELDLQAKRVRVEAGITWRELQTALDPHGLSVSIMQSYANFTVGGSLSVNAHGRYVGAGPLVRSVLAIELVMADGRLIQASPTENADLFYGAIGGYGGLGVIVSATLALTENTHVVRSTAVMPVASYAAHFQAQVRDDPDAVFHNADWYPPMLEQVRVQTWSRTSEPLTTTARFRPGGRADPLERVLLYWVTALPFGKELRQHVYDPLALREQIVVTRNYEASHDASSLEPSSRTSSTYALVEYFVPVAAFDTFASRLREVLLRHEVNVLNVSIRHARPDPGTVLAWAREEVFCFVIYYEQKTSSEGRAHAAEWTRAGIEAALSVGGTYYLPYQPHGSLGQLRRAYPRFDEFVALKRRVDPEFRLRNQLWDKYIEQP